MAAWLVAALGLALYALLSLWSLPWFPFIHSDEAWLASLTRSMLAEGSPAATEDFFVLTPRYPHAIKVLFHILQMPFVAASFSAFSVRLLSWATGVGTLVLLFATARRLYRPTVTAGGAVRDPGAGSSPLEHTGATGGARPIAAVATAAAVGLAAADVQLLTAFHTARQETVLVLVLTLALFLFFRRAEAWRRRDTIALGLLLGASIGVHPNSFIVAAPFVPLMLTVRPAGPLGRIRFSELGVLIAILGACAALSVALSLLMDRGFFSHYAAFGEAVGVADPFLRRGYRFGQFFAKLWHQAAGTYYLPPIRLQMVAGAVSLAGGVVILVSRRAAGPVRAIGRLLISVAALLAAIFAVGKYSPPSIVFLFPPMFLLIGTEAAWAGQTLSGGRGPAQGAPRRRLVAAAALAVGVGALVVASGLSTVRELREWRAYSYADYTAAVREHVAPDDVVLGNLNTAFALEHGQLRSWRDLASLEAAGLSFAEFVRREGIDVILYPDELDVIYNERPVWNGLYGNLYPYYEEMQRFLADSCELVGVYSAPVYAMRIVPKMAQGERLRVYRLRTVSKIVHGDAARLIPGGGRDRGYP